MIQLIKTNVLVGGDTKELSIEYSEGDDIIYIYLDDTLMCSMDYRSNFKPIIKKILEQW